MPWDYKTNRPDAVKFLHPKIAKKAISIANAILREGGDEGTAIATGIKKSKGLVKLAFLMTLGGAALGASIGHKFDKDEEHRKGARIGALIGAVGGATGSYQFSKWAKGQNFGYHGRPGGYHYQKPPKAANASNIESFFKEHGGVPHSSFKTKKEATKVYYQASRKHHPDMGGNPETFKKVNNDWDQIKKSSWFEKLAYIKDGKWLKDIMKAIKSGNDKYLVENYDKIKEKLQEPIL